MPNIFDRNAVFEAARITLTALPTNRAGSVVTAGDGDPELLEKRDPGKKIYRIRILPTDRPRRPKGFWDASWRFYEIGAGRFPNPMTRWEVQFFMACNNQKCGKGRYTDGVRQILDSVSTKRSEVRYRFDSVKQFAFLTISGRELNPDTMGESMAWIIGETLPRFRELAATTEPGSS